MVARAANRSTVQTLPRGSRLNRRAAGIFRRHRLLFTIPALWLLGWIWLSTSVFAQSLTAQVDRNPIHEDETVHLIVQLDGQANASTPDFTPLEEHFEVLGTSQSTKINMMNGRTTQITEWLATLIPKQTGNLTIPALEIGQARSTPIQVTVLPAGPGHDTHQTRNIFLETAISPKEPYVQSHLIYTVRIFHAIPIREGQLSDPQLPNATVTRLGEDVSFDTMRQGRSYHVTERKYVIVPQTSGTITIPGTVFTGQVIDASRQGDPRSKRFPNGPQMFGADPFGSFLTPLKTVRLRSRERRVTVRPIPPRMQGAPWLPAEKLDVSESWSHDLSNTHQAIHVGDPLTRTITMKAVGLMGDQLPDIAFQDTQAPVNIYPDQPAMNTTVKGNKAIGVREQQLVLVPTQAGTVVLPEIRIPWWDVKNQVRKVAVLPGRTFTILPPAGQAAPAHPSQTAPSDLSGSAAMEKTEERPALAQGAQRPQRLSDASSPSMWPSLAGVLFLAWMATLVGWWRSRSARTPGPIGCEPSPSPSLTQSRQAVHAACRRQSIHETKETLLQWAAMQWEHHPPRSLGGIAKRLSGTPAHAAILELDRLLYTTSDEPWDGLAFWNTIAPILQAAERPAAATKTADPLPALYLSPERGAHSPGA